MWCGYIIEVAGVAFQLCCVLLSILGGSWVVFSWSWILFNFLINLIQFEAFICMSICITSLNFCWIIVTSSCLGFFFCLSFQKAISSAVNFPDIDIHLYYFFINTFSYCFCLMCSIGLGFFFISLDLLFYCIQYIDSLIITGYYALW